MLWVYGHYKYFHSYMYSAGIDYQNLTSKVDPRAVRVTRWIIGIFTPLKLCFADAIHNFKWGQRDDYWQENEYNPVRRIDDQNTVSHLSLFSVILFGVNRVWYRVIIRARNNTAQQSQKAVTAFDLTE